MTNPKTIFGDKKVKLQYVPLAANIAIATALTEGIEKYGAYNWRDKPVPVMTYIGATLRHLGAFVEGEDEDPDSNDKLHLDGALASLAIIVDAMSLGAEHWIDDRPVHSSPGALYRLKQTSTKK